MSKKYSDELNVLILLSLLKSYGIKKIIASPGTTNAPFVRSIQIDSYFDVYSAVDERSAAYMACGLAAESNEPVVLTCTGATASRNYLPGLTEAFYRKLPILAVTSTRDKARYGHLEDQVIDRTVLPNDTAKFKVHIPNIKDVDDEWECRILISSAILELHRNGGGPVHINLSTRYNRSYSVNKLPNIPKLMRYIKGDTFPKLPNGKIGIFVGSHRPFLEEEQEAIDAFCASNDAVVFCDHTSGYSGKYKVNFLLASMQIEVANEELMPDTLIHIGEVSGFYHPFGESTREVWRISPDGEIRDLFKKLKFVFEMDIAHFFNNFEHTEKSHDDYLQKWNTLNQKLRDNIPDVPFSNIWVAKQLSNKIPKGSNVHFGILNSLSSWNYFDLDNSISTNCNVGGYGIDGCVSSLIGASLSNANKIYFGFVGDLAFFYDMNSIGNRHVGKNIRILVVNNGKGIEFKIKNNPATQFGEDIDEFIAAAGHFGNKSKTLLRDYAGNLGFEYLAASSKDEFLAVQSRFVSPNIAERPILLEVFTNDSDEDKAQKQMKSIVKTLKGSTKRITREIIGDAAVNKINKWRNR